MDSTSDTLFWSKDVADWPALFGGDGDDGGDDADDGAEDESDDGAEDFDSDDSLDSDLGDDEDSDDEDDEDDEEDDVDYRAENRGLRKEVRRLTRDLEAATDLLEEYDERGEHPERDELVAQANERVEELESLMNGMVVREAMRNFTNRDGSPKWDWEDLDDVFNALDADDLDIDLDHRTVDGLEDQLEEIARKKPHWLKTKKPTRRRSNEDREPSGSSGSGPIGSGRRSGRGKTREEYAAGNNAYHILVN